MESESTEAQFLAACATGEIGVVRNLLTRLKNIDCRHPKGWSGLIMACHGAHAEVAKLLVQNGADVNLTNSKGTTVFMYAKTPTFESKDYRLLEWLLEQGADINSSDQSGKTALDYVVAKGDADLESFLRKNGALTGLAQSGSPK